MFNKETTLVSFGDFLDVYHKVKHKGFGKLSSVFNLNANKRVSGKWNDYQTSSDYWIIPELNHYWNQKISGDASVGYEAYVSKKYLAQKKNIRMLSVGCGAGAHERNFAKNAHFQEIVGVDLSEKRIHTATQLAKSENLPISYFAKDFRSLQLEESSFDLILFNASLHHFDDISNFLRTDIKHLLKPEGILVINEYCGPNRLQWTSRQLRAANQLLQTLPNKYKVMLDGTTLKKRVYRPGLIRMFLIDPSEAPDSKNLLNAVCENFETLEQTHLGGNLLHCMLKGIAHNFLDTSRETKDLLNQLITEEEAFVDKENSSDSVFGVYKNF